MLRCSDIVYIYIYITRALMPMSAKIEKQKTIKTFKNYRTVSKYTTTRVTVATASQNS